MVYENGRILCVHVSFWLSCHSLIRLLAPSSKHRYLGGGGVPSNCAMFRTLMGIFAKAVVTLNFLSGTSRQLRMSSALFVMDLAVAPWDFNVCPHHAENEDGGVLISEGINELIAMPVWKLWLHLGVGLMFAH